MALPSHEDFNVVDSSLDSIESSRAGIFDSLVQAVLSGPESSEGIGWEKDFNW